VQLALKPPILGVQGYLRSLMLILQKACHRCLLWYAACLCLSATVSKLDEPISIKNSVYNHFIEGYPSLTLTCIGLLEPRESWLKIYVWCWKFHMQVVLAYLHPFQHNSLLRCVLQRKISKNSLKPFIFGGSRSFQIIDTPWKLVTSACYDK